jgi:hypothetical protein
MSDLTWQPIKTAPSDGTLVWVYGRADDQEQVALITADGDWWRYERARGSLSVPSHWMPLERPAPPILETSHERAD